MAHKAKLFIFSTAFILFGVSAPVFAVTEAETTEEVTTTQETQTTTAEPEITEPKDRSAGREARIEAYKENAEEKLSEAKQKRISGRCKSAQGKITSLRSRVNNAVANRKKVYLEIGDKLDSLLAKMQKAGLDTTVLETAREDMRADLVILTESLNAYDTALADLEAMDCTTDPATFMAALTSTRELLVILRAQAQDFRRFATEELRAILQDARTQLANASGPIEEATTEQDGEE